MKRAELAPYLFEYSNGMPLKYRVRVAYRHLVGAFHVVLDSIPEGVRLFDIGCGTGALLYLALKLRNVEVAHGYDISQAAVSAAPPVSAPIGRFKIMYNPSPVPPGILVEYDVVTVVDVLHHLSRQLQSEFLTVLIRTVRRGALVIISDIEGANVVSNGAARVHDLVFNRELVSPMTGSEVTNILQENHVRVVSCDYCWSFVFKSFVITGRKE